jgi:hypothetical protein
MFRLMSTRPQDVNWSISLLLASLAIGPIVTVIDLSHLKSLGPIQKIILDAAITFLLLGFLIWKMAQGRNWARITLLVFFLLGLPFYFFFVRAEFSRSSILAMLSILQALLQAAGLLIAFVAPAKYWFKTPVKTNNELDQPLSEAQRPRPDISG